MSYWLRVGHPAIRLEISLTAPTTSAKNNCILNARKILATTGAGVKVVKFLKDQAIFIQGVAVGAVFYIQKGKVGFTVASKFGKEATLGVFSEGEFFGEGSLAEQPLRSLCTAHHCAAS